MRALIWSLLVLVALLTRAARAETEIGVVVRGEPGLRLTLASVLEGWLREHGHVVVAQAMPEKSADLVHDCFVVDDEGCATRVLERLPSPTALVYARVEQSTGRDGERNVTLTGYWIARGASTIVERRYCERCGEQGLRGAAAELMEALAREERRGTGTLEVASTPPGARVLLDGEPVGVTPFVYEVAPGTHRIVVRHDRHEVATRNVSVRAGQTSRIDVPLVASSTLEPRRSRALPGALLAGGAALALTGGVLLAIDEDASLHQRYHRDTAPVGVACATIGVGALLAGTYLWLRAPSAKPTQTAVPTAALTRDGVFVGWATTY
ncbi:MAG: PEGA domain-containing protein [Kofleriaceae bacterium]|nr:PEGA domain-containing protein [Kofleriaceae bacterium]